MSEGRYVGTVPCNQALAFRRQATVYSKVGNIPFDPSLKGVTWAKMNASILGQPFEPSLVPFDHSVAYELIASGHIHWKVLTKFSPKFDKIVYKNRQFFFQKTTTVLTKKWQLFVQKLTRISQKRSMHLYTNVIHNVHKIFFYPS